MNESLHKHNSFSLGNQEKSWTDQLVLKSKCCNIWKSKEKYNMKKKKKLRHNMNVFNENQ